MNGFTVVFEGGKSGNSLWASEREARVVAKATNQRDGFTGPKAVGVREVKDGKTVRVVKL